MAIRDYMGVSQKGLGFRGVSIIRILVVWGLYWGPPILESYHIKTT